MRPCFDRDRAVKRRNRDAINREELRPLTAAMARYPRKGIRAARGSGFCPSSKG